MLASTTADTGIDWASREAVELVVKKADGTAGIEEQLAPSLFFVSARPLAIVLIFVGALAVLFGALFALAGRSSTKLRRSARRALAPPRVSGQLEQHPVLPRVLGLTWARSRNSATPSSIERSSCA